MEKRLLLITLGLLLAPIALAAPSPGSVKTSEISVTLFGQPCLLSGPFEKDALKAIHAVSPEQSFVDPTSLSPESYKKVLEKLRATQGVPAFLDIYRDHKTKRLEAQLAFLTVLGPAKKAQKAEPLLAAIKGHISEEKLKRFTSLAAKLEAKKTEDGLDAKLFDSFNEMIEPDPEDEFHRTNRKMNVNYACDFADEGETEEGGE